MAASISLEMYRLYGEYPDRFYRKATRRKPSAAELIARQAGERLRPHRKTVGAHPDSDRR